MGLVFQATTTGVLDFDYPYYEVEYYYFSRVVGPFGQFLHSLSVVFVIAAVYLIWLYDVD